MPCAVPSLNALENDGALAMLRTWLMAADVMQEERPAKRPKTGGAPMRTCLNCHEVKKIAKFSREPGGPDGRQTWCMDCMKVCSVRPPPSYPLK